MQLGVRLASRTTLHLLGAVIGLLAAAHLALMLLTHFTRVNVSRLGLLELNAEYSFGTMYSVALLLASAVLLAILAAGARRQGVGEARDARYWTGLAVLFVFLAWDEATQLHEEIMIPVRDSLNVSGALYYAWIIPYGIFAAAIAVLFSRFLFRLPREVSLRVMIAGAIYVAGAAGMEVIAGQMVAVLGFGLHSIPMELEYLVEETMEMFGVAYFITALLRYVELGGKPLRLAVDLSDDTLAV